MEDARLYSPEWMAVDCYVNLVGKRARLLGWAGWQVLERTHNVVLTGVMLFLMALRGDFIRKLLP